MLDLEVSRRPLATNRERGGAGICVYHFGAGIVDQGQPAVGASGTHPQVGVVAVEVQESVPRPVVNHDVAIVA